MPNTVPGCCELCGRQLAVSEHSLCTSCFGRLLAESLSHPVVCPACGNGRILFADGICALCHSGEEEDADGRCLARYLEPWPRLVQAIKFGSKAPLAQDLGRLMALCLGSPREDELVTWVPLAPRRFMLRGFNQAARLARAYARACGHDPVPLLRRIRGTRAQARLGASTRRYNLAGAFSVIPGARLEGREIILIDDVVTTGATTRGCRQVLHAAGARQVRVFSLCCG